MGRKVSDNITDAELKSSVEAARQRIGGGSAKAPVKITVGQGAQLWVMDADEQKGCYWRLPYRFHGKQKVLALGTCTITSTKTGNMRSTAWAGTSGPLRMASGPWLRPS